MTNRQTLARRVGLVLLVLGGLMMLLGFVQIWLPGMPESTPAGFLKSATMDVPVTMKVAIAPSPTSSPTTHLATSTPQPLVPTPTPTAVLETVTAQTGTVTAQTGADATLPPDPTRTSSATPDPTATAAMLETSTVGLPESEDVEDPIPFSVPQSDRYRLGVSLPPSSREGDPRVLGAGWVMDWLVRSSPPYAGVEYVQVVGLRDGVLQHDTQTLTSVAAARPGSLWLVSNEPDVRWQDNVTAEVYARLYHEAYMAIKAGDSSATVAAGGISQPSELRLLYLDLVLHAYTTVYGEPLPADAWHVHNYMLREERDSWGVDIPPGMPENVGALHSIDDSGNLDMFKGRIVSFRRWMADRGYGGLPLIVSEFGIPMPAEYGFPPDRVAAFLRETWQWFYTATDPTLGDPLDGGRLVQRWCWYSMEEPAYPTGNLYDSERDDWTALGRTWTSMVRD